METFDLRRNTELINLSWSVNTVDVTRTGPVPDPDWIHTDSAGHAHRWAYNETVPSLRVVADRMAWSDDTQEEYVAESHYECIWCGERVEPKTVPGNDYVRMAAVGPKHGTATVKTMLIELGGPLRHALETYEEIECQFTKATVRGRITDLSFQVGLMSYLIFTLSITGVSDASRHQ